MARQSNEALELERETESLRETLYLLKAELHRIRHEFFEGATSLTESSVNDVDEELETLTLTIENALFG